MKVNEAHVMAESSMTPFTEDFEYYKNSDAGDYKVCPICRGMRNKVFKISERKAGVNFPPYHPWCRCTFEIVVDDWDKWMDDYVEKHGDDVKQTEKIVKRMSNFNNDSESKKRILQKKTIYLKKMK